MAGGVHRLINRAAINVYGHTKEYTHASEIKVAIMENLRVTGRLHESALA